MAKKLTSVKIEEDLFNEFKVDCVKENFTFQKLAERAIYLYLTDDEFKEKIKNLIKHTYRVD